MAQGYQALTEKEKQTLRLLLAGHDAKSMARHFGLSVHTVNERLRDARRKLSASSSREAARVLRDAEGSAPDSVVDNHLRDVTGASSAQSLPNSTAGSPSSGRATWVAGGLVMILLAAALLMFGTAPETPADPAGSATVAESAVTQSTRLWLALVDAGKWQESWAATGKSFRKLNTVEVWQSVSIKVRLPLGQPSSRVLVSEQSVPAIPAGNQIVKFRTDFANKSGVIETVALAPENGTWRVVGYYID